MVNKARATRESADAAARRNGGLALALVVVALVVASVLALPFLAAQTTSSTIARNIVEHDQARAIADSGLAAALAAIGSNSNWRDAMGAGVWVNEQAYAGGQFSVTATDGDADEPGLSDPVVLTCEAYFGQARYLARVRVEGGTEGAAFDHALAVAELVWMQDNSRVDALDSRSGNYVAGPPDPGGPPASVATNTTGANQVHFQDTATLHGDLLIGPGGDPGEVVEGSGGEAGVTGEVGNLEQALALPQVTPPVGGPTNPPDSNFPSAGQRTLAGGTHWYRHVRIGDGFELRIQGDVTIVAAGTLEVSDEGRIVLQPGATLTVYADRLRFEHNARVNAPASGEADPAAVTMYQTGSDALQLDNNVEVAARLVAPAAELQMVNNARLFGAFVGRSASLRNHARLTQDLALKAAAGGQGQAGGKSLRVTWLGPAE